MIKHLLILVAIVFTGASIQAQNGNPTPEAKTAKTRKQLNPEERTTRIVRMMTSKTGLSEPQQAEVKQIILERERVRASARNADGSFNETKKEEVKAANKKAAEQLKTILTPEQLKQWEAFKAELKQRKAEKRQDAAPDGSRGPDLEEDFY